MCSVNEEELDDGNQFMEVKPPIGVGTLCKKCEVNKAEVVLRIRDAYCRDCFISSTTHKFRAVLGKSRLLKIHDNVLIAVSPSNSSLALLHLVKTGVNDTTQKRLRCTPYAVYIDGAVLDQTSDQRKRLCSDIVRQILSFGIPTYVSSLDKSLISEMNSQLYVNADNDTNLELNEEGDAKLRNLIADVQSLTSRDDLVQKLRHKLLFIIAEQLKCNKIFVAETGTHLAIKLMTNLSLGRGAQLPYDIGFCDSRHPDVKLLRPLRDLTSKEIVFYNIFNDMEAIHCPSFGTKSDPYCSIQKLTEKFIVELQNEFPSTISTVFRTGEKLSADNLSHTPEESCVLCQAPLDTLSVASSALQATEFSRLVSRLGPSGFPNHSVEARPNLNCEVDASDCRNISECGCQRSRLKKLTRGEVEPWLCYGCRLILRDMQSLDHLPSSVLRNIQENMRLQAMRNEIKDFLL
ncbi:cytoplasmic tRNA 2-thiolation protein 2-A isoform X2 [Anabrus simplex]|uniref:cytoplasmic tRNA 2-thiolation protein 2-A isoform X2 n=1 Tax=Anabrus simplex TaxID=316456 RepID=UPI0035A31250